MSHKIPNLLLFNMYSGHNSADLSTGSNLWQVKNYEEVSEIVYVLYLGKKGAPKIVRNGATIILRIGSGNSKIDMLKAPFRIYKFVQRKKIKNVVTYEQIFLWWFVILIKLLRKCKVILLPVTYPDAMYKIRKKALSVNLPIWAEKITRRISSFFVDIVITPEASGEYKKWLSNDVVYKKKLRILQKVVEGIPSPFFAKEIQKQKLYKKQDADKFNILCVSRLRKEKLVDDVINCFGEVIKSEENVFLHIIGEGEDRDYFETKVDKLGIEKSVKFYGYMPLLDVVPFYNLCDVYVSTLTGSAMREVALYGMPVVAYEMDWVKDTFKNNVDYIAVEPYNFKKMAEAILLLKNNKELSKKLASNINFLALEHWSLKNLEQSYHNIFL